MCSCWDLGSKERPTFTDVVVALDNVAGWFLKFPHLSLE